MTSTARLFVVGTTSEAFARREARRAASPKYVPGKLDGWQMNAKQRHRDLERLARHRLMHGPALGEELAWAKVIANMVRVMEVQVNVEMVNLATARLGLPPLNATIVAVAVREIAEKAWRRYALYTPKEAGILLAVTRTERAAAGLVKLDAIDESSEERRKRLNRERMSEKRAAEAALHPKRASKAVVAKALNISRAELYRRLKAGEISETEFVRMSITYGNNPRTESVSKELSTDNG